MTDSISSRNSQVAPTCPSRHAGRALQMLAVQTGDVVDVWEAMRKIIASAPDGADAALLLSLAMSHTRDRPGAGEAVSSASRKQATLDRGLGVGQWVSPAIEGRHEAGLVAWLILVTNLIVAMRGSRLNAPSIRSPDVGPDESREMSGQRSGDGRGQGRQARDLAVLGTVIQVPVVDAAARQGRGRRSGLAGRAIGLDCRPDVT
jgi:hypothetical protein